MALFNNLPDVATSSSPVSIGPIRIRSSPPRDLRVVFYKKSVVEHQGNLVLKIKSVQKCFRRNTNLLIKTSPSPEPQNPVVFKGVKQGLPSADELYANSPNILTPVPVANGVPGLPPNVRYVPGSPFDSTYSFDSDDEDEAEYSRLPNTPQGPVNPAAVRYAKNHKDYTTVVHSGPHNDLADRPPTPMPRLGDFNARLSPPATPVLKAVELPDDAPEDKICGLGLIGAPLLKCGRVHKPVQTRASIAWIQTEQKNQFHEMHKLEEEIERLNNVIPIQYFLDQNVSIIRRTALVAKHQALVIHMKGLARELERAQARLAVELEGDDESTLPDYRKEHPTKPSTVDPKCEKCQVQSMADLHL